MIYFTRREAEKDGRTFCAYLLTMAANALDDDAADVNEALRAKLSPGDLLRSTKRAEQGPLAPPARGLSGQGLAGVLHTSAILPGAGQRLLACPVRFATMARLITPPGQHATNRTKPQASRT
ncbi:hypothetical protein V6L77_23035 [Pannonibacter sp. Pt2-lr]